MSNATSSPLIAIACGGTGGHLFPGLAVGEELRKRGCDVMLLVSPKDVDQQAVRAVRDMQVVTLPAVGLVRGNIAGFFKGFRASMREAKRVFASRPPAAVLAMGGFTSAPPVLAGKKLKAATFLHESNTIPGRANRFLAWFVSEAFVGFPSCAERLRTREVRMTGTPVRPQFTRGDTAAARVALGLDPKRDTLLVMGGSQGASAINQLIVRCLGDLRRELPEIQFLHLTGPRDHDKVVVAYREAGARAVVRPFLTEMDLALNAATVAVSRSGASSLAEFAAMRVPAILIPFPAATDNHQFHNARAFVEKGAARMLGEQRSTPENLTALVRELMTSSAERERIQQALAEWHFPNAAAEIAEAVLRRISKTFQLSHSMKTESQGVFERLRSVVSPETMVLPDEPLSKRTTLRVGGKADVFAEPANETDLAAILRVCAETKTPFTIIGRGSNLLIRDGGVRGVVICLGHEALSRVQIIGEHLHCGAGAKLKTVSVEARRAGLAGLEFLEGIPGSVGGAMRMNAGAMGSWMFEVVEHIRFMDFNGNIHEQKASEVNVEYRGCPLFKTHIALGAVLRGTPAPKEVIQERANTYNSKRWETQPAQPSAGCIFKNTPTVPAGKLIDELGLKGTKRGGAMISTVHGNFIVNEGNASARDVLELIQLVKETAKAKRGIELETEVEIIGE